MVAEETIGALDLFNRNAFNRVPLCSPRSAQTGDRGGDFPVPAFLPYKQAWE